MNNKSILLKNNKASIRKKHCLSILLLLILLSPLFSFSQQNPTWKREYYPDEVVAKKKITEEYDYGYLLSGWFTGAWPSYCYLKKVDINGQPLWNKVIGNEDQYFILLDHKTDQNGNIVIVGDISQKEPYSIKQFVLKLNACGEFIWCKLISGYVNSCSASKINIIPDGRINVLLRYAYTKEEQNEYNTENKRASIIQLSEDGDIIWHKYYNPNNQAKVSNKEGYFIQYINKASTLLCGKLYQKDPESPVSKIKAYFAKISNDGEMKWYTILDSAKFDFSKGEMHLCRSLNLSQIKNIFMPYNQILFRRWKSCSCKN